MRIGVPTEIKDQEYRVGCTPAGVRELVIHGHDVLVEAGAGLGSSIPDDEFVAAGARMLEKADDVWNEAELVLKVKEPVPEEYRHLRRGQVLFTYLHLAASRSCTEAVLDSGVTAIAYETVELADGSLPLLAPMSEVAGRMAPQAGATHLQRYGGGRGVLMGGVPGVDPSVVVVLGAGVAGLNAATIAMGMQAQVTVLDRDVAKLRQADRVYRGKFKTLASSSHVIERCVLEADLVIGAVLLAGAKAPRLVTDELVANMKQGSVLVDISIDQGGCFEHSRPTTHAEPVFEVHQSLYYCVANMPGAVPHTSTYALANATLPYTEQIADLGWRAALRADPALGRGLNAHDGRLVHPAVAEAYGLPSLSLPEAIDG